MEALGRTFEPLRPARNDLTYGGAAGHVALHREPRQLVEDVILYRVPNGKLPVIVIFQRERHHAFERQIELMG